MLLGMEELKVKPVALQLVDKAHVCFKALCTLDFFNAVVGGGLISISYLQTTPHVTVSMHT